MKTTFLILAGLVLGTGFANAQTSNPAVYSWLQNTSGVGSYYMQGNSTPISNNIEYNCQEISYSNTAVYVATNGIPSFPTGPFLDGNPSQAESQNTIFRFPLNPQEETGTKTSTTMGTIGVFINGVSLYDYRDGVAWNTTTNALCGGPGNPPCPGGPQATMDWNRDAIPAEMDGFDCSKGHPAMGSYHHHQNPSAFKLDHNVVSTICNLYDADGLYAIDSTQHSPLLGFAYDGFPIYGAYGYANENGSGGIVRIKSSYELGTHTTRTHHANGTDVDDGPDVNSTYFLGYFREDYLYVDHSGQEDYLDEHNGRWCVTPEYPQGTYAYFCTVDENWNSAFPYAVGPTFYGEYEDRRVNVINETVTVYDGSSASITETDLNEMNFNIFPNPATDLIAIQVGGVVENELTIDLVDLQGRVVMNAAIHAGQTIAYFDVSTLYAGSYLVRISADDHSITRNIQVQ